jgi:hypothetical protein
MLNREGFFLLITSLSACRQKTIRSGSSMKNNNLWTETTFTILYNNNYTRSVRVVVYEYTPSVPPVLLYNRTVLCAVTVRVTRRQEEKKRISN